LGGASLTQPASAQQSPSKLFRSADGKIRVDAGNISVITDPATQKTIMLDHLKKEASLFSAQPPQLPSGALPNAAMPALAMSPPTSPAKVEDLGKAMIEGHEVMGKRFTFQPPAAPQMPGMPQLPGMPRVPQVPGAQLPKTALTTSEIWTSTTTQLPVLSRTRGSFGEQTCHCKFTQAGEPHPSLFQVPAGYKTVTPPALPH
jgi:hypothetical protein